MSLSDQQWSPTSVQVTVLQARGLRIKGKSGTNDAYAVMQVAKEKYQTSVAEKSVAPMWQEEAAFDLPAAGGGGTERTTLHVHVLHRALVGPDKLLGQAVINLLQLSEDKSRAKTEWFKLLDKTGKPDKDRGEVRLDIQFMRNNMTCSMFDLSAAGKSRSRLGKLKDKVRGKKKESGSASGVVPSFSQVLTDSEDEANGDGKTKKHKRKSLFSPKSNLQKTLSQSMSVLPATNSSLSGSQSSGLNLDSSQGKKKFKFKIHKRSGSSDLKDSSSGQKQVPVEQSNLCINGSHVYCEEPPAQTSRIGSNFSLTSSGHGSMEYVPENSPQSVESLRGGRQCSPWTEEEEEAAAEEENKEEVEESREEEEEKSRMEEVGKKREEEEGRKQQEEFEKLSEEMTRHEQEKRSVEEEKYKREEEEKTRREEEVRAKRERETLKKQEEERERIDSLERMQKEEGERIRQEEERKRIEEEERIKMEEEERIRLEEERKIIEEEKRIKMEEERIKLEEERKRIEEDKRIRLEEEERIRLEEERKRIERVEQEEEWKRIEEEERVKQAEERKRVVEEMRIKMEEERKRIEMQERMQKEEEERTRLAEEKRRIEEEEKIRLEEERNRVEEGIRMEEERKRVEEKIRLEEEEKKRVEEEERKRVEEKIRLAEERKRVEDGIRMEEERKRVEEKIRLEEEERKRVEEEERIRLQEESRVKMEAEMKRIEAEEERERKEQEMRVRREKEIRLEREERLKKEKMQEEERIRVGEEERVRKEKEEHERLLAEEERMRKEEQNRREEKSRKEMERAEQEKRVRKEKERAEREKEARRLEKERLEKEKKEPIKKVAGRKTKLIVPAEVISTNPFDEDFSSDPFEEPSSSGPAPQTASQQRCQPAVSSSGSNTEEKDLIGSQREKRPAPQPPGRNQPEKPCQTEQLASAPLLSQINKHGRDIKTISVPPQRHVQSISPLTRCPTDSRDAHSLTESAAVRETVKPAKRPAPSKPQPEELPPKSTGPHGSDTKQVQVVYGLNPFEDDEDENELAVNDDTAVSGGTRSVAWPPPVSPTADHDAASLAKIKSAKVARAPPPPAQDDPTSSAAISQDTVPENTGGSGPEKAANKVPTEGLRSDHVEERPLQEAQPTTVQNGLEAGVKKPGPPVTSRRLQPVKPLNPVEQPAVSVVQGENDKSSGILSRDKTKIDTGNKGPYSQLTQEELISLVVKQERQLSEREKKISDLEQYIDSLLVRVIEEQPSILMSLSAVKKPA